MTQYHLMITQAYIMVSFNDFDMTTQVWMMPFYSQISMHQTVYLLVLGLAQSINDNWFATSSRPNHHCSVSS